MNCIKYQVFISSTYKDLIEERKQVLQVLLKADCIPAGMENFVATDDEQFNVIKNVIDLCDYYILILGRRYGSINARTGISYTEMEYNYAIERGIPVLVFSIDDSAEIDPEKVEKDPIKNGKLAEFKNRAMNNRLSSVWQDMSDLIAKVAISIMRAKTEIKRPGWHRGPNDSLNTLSEKNCCLESDNTELEGNFYNKLIELHFVEKVYIFTDSTRVDTDNIEVTLSELFKFVSLRLTGVKTVLAFENAISAFKPGYEVEEQDALIVKNKFEHLKLIECYVEADNIEYIRLTNLGKSIMNELNA